MTGSLDLEAYAADFAEEPGYLDFAAFGPIARAVAEEQAALTHVLEHARFGASDAFRGQEARMREAVGALVRVAPDRVVAQPNTSTALLHALWGVRGAIVASRAEFPSVTYAAVRASAAMRRPAPRFIEPAHGRVTPGELRGVLDSRVKAVAVSLVDFRTGFVADLEGIRQVIGDRLLVVDASQGIGVVDAAWEAADAIAAGGQTWLRAGWGTGFLALGERALGRLEPVLSGHTGSGADLPMDEVLPSAADASAYSIARSDPIALARLATATERVTATGVAAISARIAERVSAIIDIADEGGIEVVSPRAEDERAGIVVLDPGEERVTPLVAALHNHGVSSTVRGGRVRLAAHVSTDSETLGMLRDAVVSFGTTSVV